VKGKWRIIEMPGYTDDFPDMMEPAYILLDGKGGGRFAFGCVTGSIHVTGTTQNVEFSWDGNNEMDEACGDGWAKLRSDGSLVGQICFHQGDEVDFTAHPWKTSSTAC